MAIELERFMKGIPTVIRQVADQAFASTTPADVTEQVFAVIANHFYKFEWIIKFTSTATNTGLEVTLTCPAGAISASVTVPIAGDGAGADFQGSITASGDSVTATAVAATGTGYTARVFGTLQPTSSGNLQLQGSSDTGTSVSVVIGTVGSLWEV